MPIPLMFIGIAAITGAAGVGTTVKAGVDHSRAKTINEEANAMIDTAALRLERMRKQCGSALFYLGEEKVYVLNNGIRKFLESFERIKNVDFRESTGLKELNKMHIDKKEFEELQKASEFAFSLAQGGIAGVAGGALTAFGAFGAASALATASTGTAIATLSGAAATNATLAFFGGGSLAAGGLGMAGGMAVLGGLVAGPALLVMGIITGAHAGKNLEEALANEARAKEICEELKAGTDQSIAIRRRAYMYYCLLARLDAMLYPSNIRLEEILREEGEDYSRYTDSSKESVMAAVSLAVSIKTILDTPILTDEGELTEASEKLIATADQY